MSEKELKCYYLGENDDYCHKEYTENIDKHDCNKCENIQCETKLINQVQADNARMREALEKIHEEINKRLIKGNHSIKDTNINHWCLKGLQKGIYAQALQAKGERDEY